MKIDGWCVGTPFNRYTYKYTLIALAGIDYIGAPKIKIFFKIVYFCQYCGSFITLLVLLTVKLLLLIFFASFWYNFLPDFLDCYYCMLSLFQLLAIAISFQLILVIVFKSEKFNNYCFCKSSKNGMDRESNTV